MSSGSLLRHGTAVAATALALALWVMGRNHVEPNPYLYFVAAVAVSAYYGGLAQGLLASFLTSVAGLTFYLHLFSRTAHTDMEQRLQFILFLLVAILVSALTARLRRTQSSLNDQLGFNQAIAVNLGEGVLALDRSGQVTYANPAAGMLLGWPPEEMVGRSVHEIVVQKDADGHQLVLEGTPLLTVLQSGSTTTVEDARLARQDGTEVSVAYTVSPIVINQHIAGCVAAIHDMSDWRRTEAALRESEDRYRKLVEISPDCIWMTDPYGYIMMANYRAAELFAYSTPQEMADLKTLDLFAQQVRAQSIKDRAAAIEGRTVRNVEYECLRADGTSFPAEVSISAVTDDDRLQALIYVARDISDRKEAEAALRASEVRLTMQYSATTALAKYSTFEHACPKLLQTICQDSGWDVGAFWSLSKNGKSLECRYIWRAPGMNTDGIEGLNLETSFARGIGLPGRIWETAETIWLEDVLEDTSAHQGITASRDKVHAVLSLPILASGNVHGVLQFFSRQVREEDPPLVQSIMAVATQIGQHIERAETERMLAEQSLHDSVTGLPGRTLFLDRLQQAVLTANRNNTSVALLMSDLDSLREVNETFGTEHGDMILQQVGSRLREQLRQNDTVARLGGDEFALILPGTDNKGAVQAAQKLLRSLRVPYTIAGQSIDVGVSMGIAVYPDHGDNADTLTRRADVAMHVAKRNNRDWAEYSPEHEATNPNRLMLTRELRQAVENNELILHYLPKVSISTGRIQGVEALVRWQHPKMGLIEPDNFITLAENTGVIQLMTMQVISMVLRQWRAWHDMGTDLQISVNLSPRLMLDPQLLSTISGLLETWGVDASWLELEWTESAIAQDPSRAVSMLARMREMGMRLSIDDFGTGYSSLAVLRGLPIDEIKIDRSFVASMVESQDSAAVVRSIIDLGHNLGLEVVAEGIEGQASFERLSQMGCDMGQGSYLSEALTSVDLIRRYGGTAPSTSPVSL